jgi:hypothetical protein
VCACACVRVCIEGGERESEIIIKVFEYHHAVALVTVARGERQRIFFTRRQLGYGRSLVNVFFQTVNVYAFRCSPVCPSNSDAILSGHLFKCVCVSPRMYNLLNKRKNTLLLYCVYALFSSHAHTHAHRLYEYTNVCMK